MLLHASSMLLLAIPAPDGPSQQCQDDAGPPWVDDIENFPNGRYHDNWPVTPMLPEDGECPGPLRSACAQKPVKAAYMDGPVVCGAGVGWFCRIIEQPNWYNPQFEDHNFGHCNISNADYNVHDGGGPLPHPSKRVRSF